MSDPRVGPLGGLNAGPCVWGGATFFVMLYFIIFIFSYEHPAEAKLLAERVPLLTTELLKLGNEPETSDDVLALFKIAEQIVPFSNK